MTRASIIPFLILGAVGVLPAAQLPQIDPDPQLASLVGQLKEHNPRLRVARAAGDTFLEGASRSLEFPDLQVRYRYFAETPETRVGPQEHHLEVMQPVPWRGKRGLGVEHQEQRAVGADWQALELECRLVAELKRAYFEAAYLQEELTLVEEEVELLGRFEQIALRRYAGGEGIQQHVIKVQTDINRLEDRRIALASSRRVLMRRIAELVGLAGETLDLPAVRMRFLHFHLDRATLEEHALQEHPQVRALESDMQAAELLGRRRALESKPDWLFGLGYTVVGDRQDQAGILNPPEDNGKDFLALTFGVSIPLSRKSIRSGVAEAKAEGSFRATQLQAARDDLRRGVQEAVLRLEAASDRARLYDEVLIPQAGESLASAEAAYTTNRQDFLDLLEAEQVLFEVRRTYWRLVADTWIALADLERAVGEEMS